jgi:hypothetical protein
MCKYKSPPLKGLQILQLNPRYVTFSTSSSETFHTSINLGSTQFTCMFGCSDHESKVDYLFLFKAENPFVPLNIAFGTTKTLDSTHVPNTSIHTHR